MKIRRDHHENKGGPPQKKKKRSDHQEHLGVTHLGNPKRSSYGGALWSHTHRAFSACRISTAWSRLVPPLKKTLGAWFDLNAPMKQLNLKHFNSLCASPWPARPGLSHWSNKTPWGRVKLLGPPRHFNPWGAGCCKGAEHRLRSRVPRLDNSSSPWEDFV